MNKQFIKSLIPPLLYKMMVQGKNKRYYSQHRKLVSKNSELSNIHQGERCFILGSGPSIKKQNIGILKNENIFALNNFYVHPDYPDLLSGSGKKYHLAAPIHPPQTETEWTSWFKDMDRFYSKYSTTMLFGLNHVQPDTREIILKNKYFTNQELFWYIPGKMVDEYYAFSSKDIDITGLIWGAGAVSVYALIIAIYMGFKEIVLLGMDHDYFLYDKESEMRMYSKSIHQKNELQRAFGNTFYIVEYLRQYKIFRQYALLRDNTNVSIINASAGGVLKVFPRKSLSEICK